MPPRSAVKPGDYVRIRSAAKSRWRNRSGLVVARERDRVLVRFAGTKPHEFAMVDVLPVLDALAVR